jgi:hypothetical protein
MSLITNVILNMGTNTALEARAYLQRVNHFFQDREVGFVSLNNWHSFQSLHVLEVDLAVGAFNYLDLGALIKHLRTIDWRDQAAVQLLVREQDDTGFRIIDVFPERLPDGEASPQ